VLAASSVSAALLLPVSHPMLGVVNPPPLLHPAKQNAKDAATAMDHREVLMRISSLALAKDVNEKENARRAAAAHARPAILFPEDHLVVLHSRGYAPHAAPAELLRPKLSIRSAQLRQPNESGKVSPFFSSPTGGGLKNRAG
jgi:hypothetical protein